MKNRLDLVCVISDLSGGGTQRVLHQLIKHWASAGKKIAVITFSDSSSDRFLLPSNVDRYVLGNVSEAKNKISGMVSNIKRIRKLRKKLKVLNAPVVLSFLASTNILTVLATFRMKIKVIISERNDPARQSFGKIWDWLREKTYRFADIVTVNSKTALQTLEKFVSNEKCKLVNNPVFPNTESPLKLNAPSLLAVGRLHHQKAYDVLLEAFAIFVKNNPDWQLIILGEGPIEAVLKTQAKALGIGERVKWMGYVDPFPYYKSADVFVMPSRYEGMPNALLEAMSCEMPVILSDALEGPLEFITHNQNALVFPSENVSALADVLDRFANDLPLRESLSYNAKKSVEPYLIENVMPQWDFVFEDRS